MKGKQVLFVAEGFNVPVVVRDLIASYDFTLKMSTSQEISKSLNLDSKLDLIVLDVNNVQQQAFDYICAVLSERRNLPLFLLLQADILPRFQLPLNLQCDFATTDTSSVEFLYRIRNLLKRCGSDGNLELLKVDGMTINLATYQVDVNGEPIDFTYLEYALLAFMVLHQGRTYSRDSLLKRVWGFDYYGGSRTVDVHVRRIRSKLGPEIAQHLETIRGVGYLWN